jgi:cold shock CspA family protein
MRLSGILKSWNDERGFGFIAPKRGGAKIFVHASAMPRDGMRPTVGESLTYELGRGRDGRPQAMNVLRPTIGQPNAERQRRREPRSSKLPIAMPLISLLIASSFVVFGYRQYNQHAAQARGRQGAMPTGTSAGAAQTTTVNFRCDGRTYCSQMTSCAEAKFFLKNCSGAKMDGNNDGVPCEQQWCTDPFAK